MSELTKRIFTSSILIVILLNCLLINNYSWLVLLIVVSLISLFEFINLSNKIYKRNSIKILTSLISFSFLSLFVYTAYEIKINKGEAVVLFLLLICISSDIGGYVVGKSIGGKKLTKISPNKTVSGSIGSFLFSLLPLGIYSISSNVTEEPEITYSKYEVIILSLLMSLACQLGDLAISYFKRKAKVKDTGSTLPGHGGILDRIDGIIFAIPCIFIIDLFR